MNAYLDYTPSEHDQGFCGDCWAWAGIGVLGIDPLKRVDLVVKAFLDMPEKKLKVVSGGAGMPKIKKLAQGAKNVQMLGWVDEKMPPKRAKDMREACERRAKLFDKDVFINRIREVFGG